MNILMVVSIVVILISIWVFFRNEKTYQQRKKIITIIFDRDDWNVARKELDDISYCRHLLYLVLFMNATKLYSQEIQDKYNEK